MPLTIWQEVEKNAHIMFPAGAGVDAAGAEAFRNWVGEQIGVDPKSKIVITLADAILNNWEAFEGSKKSR